jgi:predicted transcriptional regulator
MKRQPRVCYVKPMASHKARKHRRMTLRLDEATYRRLERLAASTDRTKSGLTAEAVERYLDLSEWQANAIRSAVKKADSGAAKFIDHDDVDRWLASWGTADEGDPPA